MREGKTTKRKTPVKKPKRPIGLAKGKLRITKSFFKPLPDDCWMPLKASRELAWSRLLLDVDSHAWRAEDASNDKR
jgi:hypothetical protein